jgi:hypothetical protein
MINDLEPRERVVVDRAVRRAAADLARRLQVNRREIALQGIIPMTWPDTSLGCPEPDRIYAQVLTTGYVLLLTCAQETYEYRTDGGRILVWVGTKDPDQ